MNTVTGIIVGLKSGNYTIIQPTPVKDFNLDIAKPGIQWDLGIDPATAFTGIAFLDTSKTFLVLLDYRRDKVLPNDQYERELFYLLKRISHNMNYASITVEKPFVSKYVRTSAVLLSLRGKIDDFLRTIPETSVVNTEYVYPNVWKSRVIDKSKGKNRYNAKGSVAEDLCDLIPPLSFYRATLSAGDLDSFDALGIILGYKVYAFSEDGQKKISGSKEHSHYSFVGYRWENEEDIDEQYLTKVFGQFLPIFKPVYLDYNEDYNLNENVMMASTNNDAVMTIIPKSLLQSFQWKLGIDIQEEGKVLIAFIYRKGHYSSNEFSALEEIFPLREEFGGRVC